MTPRLIKRARKKANRAAAVRDIDPCDYCGSLRHQAPSYLCRRFLAQQRIKGQHGPYPSGKRAAA